MRRTHRAAELSSTRTISASNRTPHNSHALTTQPRHARPPARTAAVCMPLQHSNVGDLTKERAVPLTHVAGLCLFCDCAVMHTCGYDVQSIMMRNDGAGMKTGVMHAAGIHDGDERGELGSG